MSTSRGRASATCIQRCGQDFAGLGLQVRRFKVSQQEKRVSKEFDFALELHPKFGLQDLRLRYWMQLDATSLAICCIWRVDKAVGGRRFQARIASQQCEVDAVGSSVQLWSCQIKEAPKVCISVGLRA